MDHGLAAEIDKCSFHVQEVDFLGYILSPEGVKMANDSIRTILDWEPPKSVKDVQVFMGFANFYHSFIYDCSASANSLQTPCKEILGNWSALGPVSMPSRNLKRRFTEPPTLRHFDLRKNPT